MSKSPVILTLPSDEELEKASEKISTGKKNVKEDVKEKTAEKKRKIEVSKKEFKYREKNSDDLTKIGKLSCTTCGKSLKAYISSTSQIYSHPVLGVLLCKSCAEFYSEGEFSVDEDGTDKYCRWCGQGGTLYLCSECNFGFCRACIKRNLNRTVLKEVDEDDWKCFACKSQPLWDLRAECAATLKCVEKKKSKSKTEPKPSTSRSSGRLICISSSETDGEQINKKNSKQKKRSNVDSSSDAAENKKRKRSSSSNEDLLEKNKKKKKNINSSNSSEEKSEIKTKYSKRLDCDTTLDSKSAQVVVTKCKEQLENLTKVLEAMSTEIKTILKEDIVVENMLEYAGRKNVIKKMITFTEMACESITQVSDNFALAYQSGIVKGVCEKSEEKSSTLSENVSAIPEKHNTDVMEGIEENSKIDSAEEKLKSTIESKVVKNEFSESDSEELIRGKTHKKDISAADSSVNELQTTKIKPQIKKNLFSESDKCEDQFTSDKTNKNDGTTDKIQTTKTKPRNADISESDCTDEEIISEKKGKKKQTSTCDLESPEKMSCDSIKSSEHEENESEVCVSDDKKQNETNKVNACDSDVPKTTKLKNVTIDDKLLEHEQDDSVNETNDKAHDKKSASNSETGDGSQSDKLSDSEPNMNLELEQDPGEDPEDMTSKIPNNPNNKVSDSNVREKMSDKNCVAGSNVSEEEYTENITNESEYDTNKESELSSQISEKFLNKQQKSSDVKELSNIECSDEENLSKKVYGVKTVSDKMKRDISKISANSNSDKDEMHTLDKKKEVTLKEEEKNREKEKYDVLSDEDVISNSGSEKLRKKKLESCGHNDQNSALNCEEDPCNKNKTVDSSQDLLSDCDRSFDSDVERKLEDMNKDIQANDVSEPVETLNSRNGISNDSNGSKSDNLSTSLLSDGRAMKSTLKIEKSNSTIEKVPNKSQSISEDEKRALLSLLASSSSDDDSSNSVERKGKLKVDSDQKTEKCGPLSSKSLSYQIANKKNESKSGVFSDASENMDVDSANKVKNSLERRNSADIESSEDSNQFSKCSVILKRLPEDVYKKHVESPSVLEGKQEKSETEEIKKLVNLKSLEKNPTKKFPSVDSELDSDEEQNISKKKVLRKHAKKKEKKSETLKDFLEENDGSSHSDHLGSSNEENKKDSGLKNIFKELINQKNKLAKELLLRSSSSDSDIFQRNVEEKKNSKEKESKIKVKEENEDKKEKIKEEKNSDESDEEIKKKKKWRSEKLLRMRLSETDTSDEERKWKAKREREDKQDKNERRKSVGRRLIKSDSDSDSVIISSDSPESDSDDFKPMMKRKHKENNDSIKSEKSSGSGSDLSKKKCPKRRRIRKPVSDSSDDNDDGKNQKNSQKSDSTPGKGRKNIRKVLKDEDVTDATRRAAKEEEERAKRIAEKQKLYNALYNLAEAQSETIDKLVLDFDPETKEELLQVDTNLVPKLKPHQVKGIKFMWDACFESLEQAEKGEGSGCILAHCMGLGKTLQVIALVHTVLLNPRTKVRTVLVVCPLSTVLNWVNEFSKWLDQTEDNDIEVLELTKYKRMYERVGIMKHWREGGGVMILSYNSYRTLSNPKIKKQKKKNIDTFQSALVDPGPDLVICDEGHLLKNEGSALSKSMNCIRTKRRIVLTGTPLQNNLLEYHCMVQFVKPSLLGTKKEFQNRFVNPINNGQYGNSTAYDVKVMKRRAHVLHKMLDSSVQRYDYSVLTPFLPPKFEYVLLIKLTELQIKLYKYFLENLSFVGTEGTKTKTARLFSDFHSLQRIWTHPRVLLMNSEKQEKIKRLKESSSEGSLRDFVVSSTSESSSESSESSESSGSSGKVKGKRKTRSTLHNESDDDLVSLKSNDDEDKKNENEIINTGEWWRQFVTDDSILDDIKQSGKLSLLFKILEECEKIGDKILVFSQSLQSLDLIEYFLQKIDEASDNEDNSEISKHKQSWVLGLDYFRLDGSSNAENRTAWCKVFNREDNYRARLFLISTRAGGLGINLVAANRVILFDASWNPSYDLQSIFRIFRFGQKKPCYIYRFLAQHTMEEKVYNRQVTKLSLACRVVDEQQIERHFSMDDLQELYNFNPEEEKSKETPLVPKDVLLAELVKGEDTWINTYHEHDTLLENKEEEELNEEERKAAWEDYEKEKQGIKQNVTMYDNSAIIAYLNKFGYSENQIRERVNKENPGWSEVQVNFHVSQVLRQILDYVTAEEYRKKIQMQYNLPVFHQNPQIQHHGMMQMQQQMQQQIQNQMQAKTGQHFGGNSSLFNQPAQFQGNTAKNHEPMPSSSLVTDDGQQRIKVKSFGHMHNSNFGNIPEDKLPNPFAIQHSASSGTLSTVPILKKIPQGSLINQTDGIQNHSATKKNLPTDVIEVE